LARAALSVNPKAGAAYAILVGISLRDGELSRAAEQLNCDHRPRLAVNP